MKKSIRILAASGAFHVACLTPAVAATAGLGTAVPTVLDGVQNLSFSTDDVSNTAVAFVPSDYLAGDNTNALGQTFTTGAHPGGYSLSAVSVRQVSWGTTFWDYTGGTVTLQIFKLNSWNVGIGSITQLASETASIAGEPDGIGFSFGSPAADARWLTVTLDSPVVLEPNAIYGFQITSTGTGGNDEFFIQLDGTNTDSYPGGSALGTAKVAGQPDPVAVWRGNDGAPSDRAFVATMTALNDPIVPAFTLEPQSFVGTVGSNVILTASATGNPTPTYQWQYSPDGNDFTNLTDGGNISGATTSTLTITAATYAQAGDYRVVAENGTTPVNSNAAFVVLNYPDPVITVEPQPAATTAGGNVSLSVSATGTGNLSYQWFKVDAGGDIALADGGNVSGASSATLQISAITASDEGTYYVIVSDDVAVADTGWPTETQSTDVWITIPDLLVTSGMTAPVTDADDSYYLPGDVAKANNVDGGGDASTYIAFDRGSKGMSFTTGPNAGGYSIGAITIQHVLHPGTSFDVRPADTFEFRLGTLDGTTKTVIYQTSKAAYAGDTLAVINGTGTGRFLTFDLSSAGIGTLNPNTTYYIEISTELGDPFIEWNGTLADGYAGGSAFGGATTAAIDGSYAAMTGDRAFHADLTALSGPGNTYASWIAAYPAVGSLTGFNDDADGDGIENGLENVFGTNPAVSSQGIVQIARSGNTITFQHPAGSSPASDVTAAYIWSTDLNGFHADGANSGGITVDFSTSPDTPVAGTTTVTATVTGTMPSRLFVALEATQEVP